MIDLLRLLTSTGLPVDGKLPSTSTRPGDAVYVLRCSECAHAVTIVPGRNYTIIGAEETSDDNT